MQLKFMYIAVPLTIVLPAGNMLSYHSPSWSILFHTFMYVNVIKNSNKYFILFYCTRVSVKAFRHSPPQFRLQFTSRYVRSLKFREFYLKILCKLRKVTSHNGLLKIFN